MANTGGEASNSINLFLRILFWLRVIMLIGSAGAMVGAFLMFWQGTLHLADAWTTLIGGEEIALVDDHAEEPAVGVAAADEDDEEHHVTQVTVQVLEAVDSFLFGVVLVIFAYSIAIGFVFRLPPRMIAVLPSWMKISGVGQLKQILAEVVVVVLVVIFARVVVESGGRFEWVMLVLPVSIVLLAGSIWLLELGHESSEDHAPAPAPPQPDPPPSDH
ncbi:MAG: YqhA family protein [Bauldia sp.]|nr:YqhA family protein [Bauldia sp.]